MTENTPTLSSQPAVLVPSQAVPAFVVPVVKDDAAHKIETVEEEPYTIKCICNFSDDDGNTIYCETCDTWQHIDCFYPDNREEAIREDFAHSCAECQPRPLNREKAIERTLRLRSVVVEEADKKPKRPPPKSHKKKPKPNDIQTNNTTGLNENGKHGSPVDHGHPAKKPKSTHRPSQSVSSQPSKRSPSYNNSRSQLAHPPSPATTPPDLPDDFQIHHYSDSFCSLYNEEEVPTTQNNVFAELAIPGALSLWLQDPETMKQEVGRTHAEVFQSEPLTPEAKRPRLEVQDATRHLESGTTLRWRFIRSTTPIEKDAPLIELNGNIGFQKDYCAKPDNLWGDLSSPLPFVFFHPILPLYIDTRREGSLARYVRRSCKPNAQLDTYLSGDHEYQFWLVSDRQIHANQQITLPWDFRLDKSVCTRWLHLLGLSDDDPAGHDEVEMDETEYTAISNWIDRILSEYGGCACDMENNCAFARFHRHYLFSKQSPTYAGNTKKKQRKLRTHTISPTSTGHATNSRAASEGHVEDSPDNEGQDETASSRSKPSSRDPTPLRQGSFDQLGILTEPTDRDKRKVAMVEDSFRRMEQQQPPRKKKRTSDGGTISNPSTKPKSRNGIPVPRGHYVDAATSRSKSGSPASLHSSNPGTSPNPSTTRQDLAPIPRQSSSTAPRPVYCDASVQTDPVEGEWFSDPGRSPKPRKRIISLSKRLLDSRYKTKVLEDDQQRLDIGRTSTTSTMEIDAPPIDEHTPAEVSADPRSPTLCDSSLHIGESTGAVSATTAVLPSMPKPDLRMQLPPVPAFDQDSTGHPPVTTPLLTTGISVQSPISHGGLGSPFVPSAINGTSVQPSPVKKKLSLSDYTKSRMNKSVGKVAGGTAILKTGISSPDDVIKTESALDSPSVDKIEDVMSSATSIPATNGVA